MADVEYPELAAIETLLKTLGPLKPEERANVLDFVFRKLGIQAPAGAQGRAANAGAELAETLGVAQVKSAPAAATQRPATDIRSFTEEKKPKTASQMVAVVAYYLEHLAPEDDRRGHVTADDIVAYFKDAKFPLPKAPPQVTLTHAKNAGYLKPLARGQYQLNPIGYNLVEHKLPEGGQASSATKRSRKSGKRG